MKTSKIRQSARGEECQIRIPGVCNGNRETVCWVHANGTAAGKGIGMKSHDLLGAYGCSACHDVVDRRKGFSKEAVELGTTWPKIELWFWEGHARSLVILIEKGLVK